MFTDRVRSTTGRLCFDTCLSVCPHLGGTPARSRWRYPAGGCTPSWYPPSDLAGGIPCRGSMPPQVPPSDLAGGYPCQGVPHLRYPPSDLVGDTPPWEPPPIRLAGGYPCQRGYPTSGTHPVRPGGTPARGTPLQVPPIRPGQGGTPVGRGYPTSCNRCST